MTIQLDFGGYELRLDRSYDPTPTCGCRASRDGRVRVGIRRADCRHLRRARATSDVAGGHLRCERGDPFGSLEAAKFVGPLTAPVSGVIAAVNGAVLADPEMVLRDPYGAAGWPSSP